jgi:uncharacterized membrane protein YidH (DUF202 family)
MTESADFWLGLQRERTRLAWARTLEALTAAQIVVTIDGLQTQRPGPIFVGLALLLLTVGLALWQYRTSHESHGADATSPAQRLAATCAGLLLLALGGLLMVVT